MRNQIKYLVNLSKNTVSLLGVGITTISAILMMVLFTMEFLDYLSNPYVGILTYLILPVIFITGLLFIPFGIWLTQRRRQRLEAAGEELPPLRLSRLGFQRRSCSQDSSHCRPRDRRECGCAFNRHVQGRSSHGKC